MHHTARVWVLGIVASLILVACGNGNGGGGEEDPTDAGLDIGPDAYQPLELSEIPLGVTFHHGAAGWLASGGDNAQSAIQRTGETFDTAFLDVQVYDEHARLGFGEWEVQKPRDSGSYRGFEDFEKDPDLGRFHPRTSDLIEEVESAFGAFGEDGFDRQGIILDFWRMRGDWYVRWDGTLGPEENRIGEGNWGFYRDDFVDEIADQIKDVARIYRPNYLLVGTEMERLLAREQQEGIAPDEFLNFRQFYRDVAEVVEDRSQDTKVGVGFNWDRFARDVAPSYGEGEKGEIPPPETLAAAFESVILPFAEKGGLIALKSYRAPDGDTSHYDFLATLDHRYDLGDISLIWYSIGSPVESASSYRRQRTYLQSFVEWNKGISPDLVVWNSLLNIDGADGAQGVRSGSRCENMMEDENFQLEQSRCFDGLIKTIVQDKEVFTYIQEQVSSE